MKSFIAASLLLFLLCGAIWANAALLSARLTRIEQFTQTLKNEDISARQSTAQKAKDAWEKDRLLFTFSVNQMELEKIDDCLARLCAAAECKSDSEYQLTVADLEGALSQTRRLITLSTEGIF